MNEEFKKVNVSVGIPAFNEEANIGYLLESLLSQEQGFWNLHEIIISSDASTDKTKEVANSFNDSRIIFIDNPVREGNAMRQNQIVREFSGDILVLLNADVLPDGKKFISEFIKPVLSNSKVGLVGCLNKTLPPETFVEKVINKSVELKNEIFKNLKNGNSVYSCHGHARVFSGALARQITWKSSVSEDAYSYFFCISQGFAFEYNTGASILYRSPQTLSDHFKQTLRFGKSQEDLSRLFPTLEIPKEYRIPVSTGVKITLKYFMKHPVLIGSYFIFQFLSKLKSGKNEISDTWEVSKSSKKLLNK